MDQPERRRYPRIPKNVFVEWHLAGDSEAVKESTSSNLSLGGIAIESSEKLEIGTKIILNIFIPDFDEFKPGFQNADPNHPLTIETSGEVRYQNLRKNGKYETGIEFTAIDMDDMVGLHLFMSNARFV